MTSCLLSCTSILNGAYNIRKEFAPFGSKFFPYRVDPFSNLKVYSFTLKNPNIYGNNGIPQSHRTGIPQSYMTGIPQSHMTGFPQSHVIGIPQSHMTGIPQSHMTGIHQNHMTGIPQSHMTGIPQSHMTGIHQNHMTGIHQNHMTYQQNLLWDKFPSKFITLSTI